MARAKRPSWVDLDDERLLDLRFKDLGLRLEGTFLEECVERLERELEQRGLRFRPHVWLGTEWYSPLGVPGLALPFYLAHPRLMRLERNRMLEVEGGTRRECMRLLRHECGHAVQHAYRLGRRRRWRELFGPSSRKYPDVYRANPRSRRFVQHLRLYYAQSHPDEDFAETFAVWLSPRSNWRKRYVGWPALKKLEYVDELMAEIAGQAPVVRTRRREGEIGRLQQTLRAHYEERAASTAPPVPEVFDRDLQALFAPGEGKTRRHESAASFLRRKRARIRELVSRWTGEYAYQLEQVLQDMTQRCKQLDLRAVGREDELVADFAVLLAVKTVHAHYSEDHWFTM